MFTCTVTGGLMAVAQLGVIAQDLGVKEFKSTCTSLPWPLCPSRSCSTES